MTDPRIRWQRGPRPLRTGFMCFVMAYLLLFSTGLLVAIEATKHSRLIGGWQIPAAGVTATVPAVDVAARFQFRGVRQRPATCIQASGFAWVSTRCTFSYSEYVVEERFGWPVPFFRIERHFATFHQGGSQFLSSAHSPAATHRIEVAALLLPLLPAAVVGGAVPLPSLLRRSRRLRRGLCPMCNYRRGTSDTCVECGYVHGMPVCQA